MYGFGFDKRTLYVIIAILLATTLINMGANSILATLLTLPGVIIGMAFHEFGHAFAADRLGDPTPRNQGRLTLDPSKHIDPTGLFLLMFARIGWGKPVQINPNNFSRVSREKGEAIVAIAGPLMSFFLAFILTIIFYAILIFIPTTEVLSSMAGINVMSVIVTILNYAIVVNIGLGVFNLIPIPPLDGSKVFLRFLPYKVRRWIDDNQMMISIVFLVLCVTGLLRYIINPVIEIVMTGMDYLVSLIFSIFI